jgi:hypothetical protein
MDTMWAFREALVLSNRCYYECTPNLLATDTIKLARSETHKIVIAKRFYPANKKI